MEAVEIKAELRDSTGKKSAKALRKQGHAPCVLYGINEEIHFHADTRAFKHLVYTSEFKIAKIEIAGKTYEAILKDIQFHPLTDNILHVDFLKLIDNHPIKVNVPVRCKGTSLGVKEGGKLMQQLRKITIKTTPDKLVHELFVDISHLELGQSVRVKDIEVSDDVEVMNNGSIPVAMVVVPRALRSASSAAEEEGEEGVEEGVEEGAKS